MRNISFKCPIRGKRFEIPEGKAEIFLVKMFPDSHLDLSDKAQERRYYAVFGKNLSVYPNKLGLAKDTERKCLYISAQDISV